MSICEDGLDDAVAFERGSPTTESADDERAFRIERVGLELDSEEFTVWLSPGEEYDGAPPDDNRIELHLRSLDDPTRTGSVQLTFRPHDGTDVWDVRTGLTEGEMADAEMVTQRLWRGRSSGGGGEVTIRSDGLPVPPPFRWYVTAQRTDEPGVGDVCPNVTGFETRRPLPTLPHGWERSR